jgi:uncharacterized membrane protein YeaQ/YmgE (transglycosylase-associated protein family)
MDNQQLFNILMGLVAFLGGWVLNNITKSKKEKQLWGSTTIAMLIAAVIVAI